MPDTLPLCLFRRGDPKEAFCIFSQRFFRSFPISAAENFASSASANIAISPQICKSFQLKIDGFLCLCCLRQRAVLFFLLNLTFCVFIFICICVDYTIFDFFVKDGFLSFPQTLSKYISSFNSNCTRLCASGKFLRWPGGHRKSVLREGICVAGLLLHVQFVGQKR